MRDDRDLMLSVAERVTLDLAKELLPQNGYTDDDGVMIGRMFAAVIHGFDSYRLDHYRSEDGAGKTEG